MSNKNTTKSSHVKSFRLAHQTLCITAFNFETKSLIGYVELLIYPLRPDLKRLKINSKQCCIYRVSINEMWDAAFSYNDPSIEILPSDNTRKDIEEFQNSYYNVMHSVDAQYGNGEITVKMPPETSLIIQEMKPFRLCIEFSLEEPKGGIKFVVPDIDGSMLERGAHLFTYGHENSSRLWFPCIDSFQEVCTWKLEFSVDIYLTAVSNGDLVETVYTPDLRKKTYHYYMSTPTAAPNIALAVGPFEVYVDPNMHEVTHFCLPHLLPILKNTTSFLHEAFEYYEELLSVRFPYSCYKQVFVDQAFGDMNTYATLSIFSTNILHSEAIIDQTPKSRLIMAAAIAEQFFGNFICMESWSDAWLTKGIAGYLTSQFRRSSFGNNEYRYQIARSLESVHRYERDVQPVQLENPEDTKNGRRCSNYSHSRSPQYLEIFNKKAMLVMRMLENRLGRDLFIQVFNKLLSLAMIVSQNKFVANTWFNLSLSSAAFIRSVSTVTGKDITDFLRQWVYESGCARFVCSFSFIRKRNIVELNIKQDMSSPGTLIYVGPLTVTIQELDGTFKHIFKIEEGLNKFEITCHSKSRRNKKKKIPLCTGIEVDMDLKDMDVESPVLWLRIDPELTTLRQVTMAQSDVMWQYQLTYERDVLAQIQAIEALADNPSAATRLALTNCIENDKLFFRVRIAASTTLTKVANKMVSTWTGPPAMINIFRKMFCSNSCNTIVKLNMFTNYQNYFIQKAIPKLMALLRTVHGICPPEVFHFILDLFKYNDNTQNKYSDNYYKAAIVDALASTITPAVTTVSITGLGPSTDALTADTRLILEEVTRYLNLEKLMPSYRLTITVSCIKAIRKLQQFGHLPSDPSLFESYARPDNFTDVRITAITALVNYTKVENNRDMFLKLLSMAKNDPEPFIQHKILECLKEYLTGTDKTSALLSSEVQQEIWDIMNTHFKHDSRLRCDTIELYMCLFVGNRMRGIVPDTRPIHDTNGLAIKKRKLNYEVNKSATSTASTMSFNAEQEINEDRQRHKETKYGGSIMGIQVKRHAETALSEESSNSDDSFGHNSNAAQSTTIHGGSPTPTSQGRKIGKNKAKTKKKSKAQKTPGKSYTKKTKESKPKELQSRSSSPEFEVI